MHQLNTILVPFVVASIVAFTVHQSSKEKQKKNTIFIFILAFIFTLAVMMFFSDTGTDVMKHIHIGEPNF